MLSIEELLQEALRPFDERAWESLEEQHPAAAGVLVAAVRAGLTPEQARDYCNDNGYLPYVGPWLAHAVAHLRRTMTPQTAPDMAQAPDDDQFEPLPEPVAAAEDIPVVGPESRSGIGKPRPSRRLTEHI